MSGWKKMARKYRTFQSAPANTRYGIHAMIGISRYNGILNLGTSSQGLYMSVMFLFKFGQPPLLIPWTEIKSIQAKQWLFYGEVYSIKTANNVRFMIPAKYLEDIQEYLSTDKFI